MTIEIGKSTGNTQLVQFRISPQQYAELSAYALSVNKTIAEVLRDQVRVLVGKRQLAA